MLGKRQAFAAAGAILALGAPAGWYLLEHFFDCDRTGLYVYLAGATTTVFALFGYVVGGMTERAEKVAEIDQLTGLFNQTTFFRIAEMHFAISKRSGGQVGMIMIDLDRFKSVNDTHGHLVGSHVISEAGKLLAESCRESDLASRFGGDEYTVFLPNTDLEGVRVVAQRFRELLQNRTFTAGESELQVTASIGAASMSCSPDSTLRSLVAAADELLYQAKDEGRDRISAAHIEAKSASGLTG